MLAKSMGISKAFFQLREAAASTSRFVIAGVSLFGRLATEVRNKALTGIVVAIPLIATVWLAQIAYHFIANISAGALDNVGRLFDLQKSVATWPLVPFFVSLVLLIALGFMATNVLGQRILDWLESALLRIPVITTIYAGVKQVIDSFKSFNNMGNFKRVVYVDYPSDGARLIGFVTGQYFDHNLGEEMTSVVIPTAPNPMTGLIIVVPNRKLTESSLTLEEAMKMVVSAGLVVPKRRSAGASVSGGGLPGATAPIPVAASLAVPPPPPPVPLVLPPALPVAAQGRFRRVLSAFRGRFLS